MLSRFSPPVSVDWKDIEVIGVLEMKPTKAFLSESRLIVVKS
jgi:hypothetical protein